MAEPTKKKKPNPTDATMRNIRALKKRYAKIEGQVKDLQEQMEQVIKLLYDLLGSDEKALRATDALRNIVTKNKKG